jgi:hypothetical protein
LEQQKKKLENYSWHKESIIKQYLALKSKIGKKIKIFAIIHQAHFVRIDLIWLLIEFNF